MDLASTPAGGDRGIDARRAADELFASTTLVELLILFFQDPERRYYVNEVIRLTGRFPRSIQLALAKLEKAGLVRSERQANARFYQLAAEHPFAPELRALIAKIPSVPAALQEALAEIPEIRAAFVRPEEGGSGEMELVVVGGDRERIEAAAHRAGERLGRTVRVEWFAAEDWARQARRERSFVRWLLEEARMYVIGADSDLPG